MDLDLTEKEKAILSDSLADTYDNLKQDDEDGWMEHLDSLEDKLIKAGLLTDPRES